MVKFIHFPKFAVVFTTAFFLNAEYPNPVYLKGKVEVIEKRAHDLPLIHDLELNTSINSNTLLATGKGSRAQFNIDANYWRLGSLSIAQWKEPNHMWLHSGSALFCSTEFQKVRFSTKDANASFEGKGTLIIEATSNGGFKLIPLEAKGTLSTEKGGEKELIGGRLLLVLGNPTEFGDAYDIDIMLMLKSSRLINAFPTPLPTFKKIGLSVYVQDLKLKGKYDALIGDATTNENLQMWKFGKKAGVKPSTSQNPESKKGFFKSFFGKE